MSSFNEEKIEEIKKCQSKNTYPDKKKAQFKAYYFKYYYNDGREFEPYFCKICGNWHLTTIKNYKIHQQDKT